MSQELRQDMLNVASEVITVDHDTDDTIETSEFKLSTATLVMSLLGEVRVLYNDIVRYGASTIESCSFSHEKKDS